MVPLPVTLLGPFTSGTGSRQNSSICSAPIVTSQTTASAIFLARTGKTKKEVRGFIEKSFGYNLSMTLDEIRPSYGFDESCQGTVPQAITAFLESEDFEDAIRNAISLGGDSDTLACITGGIAQAFYGGVPGFITQKVMEILDEDLRNITLKFMDLYCKT